MYHFVRWKDGSTIVKIPFGQIVQNHGAPYWLVHRHDLHKGLLEAAQRAGVKIINNKRVVEYDFNAPSVRTADDQLFTAELIIAADGKRTTAIPYYLPPIYSVI